MSQGQRVINTVTFPRNRRVFRTFDLELAWKGLGVGVGGGGTLSLFLSFLEGVAEGVVLAGGKINPGSWHSLVTPDDGINAQNL